MRLSVTDLINLWAREHYSLSPTKETRFFLFDKIAIIHYNFCF